MLLYFVGSIAMNIIKNSLPLRWYPKNLTFSVQAVWQCFLKQGLKAPNITDVAHHSSLRMSGLVQSHIPLAKLLDIKLTKWK
jgi:hypothetical protein